MSSKTTHNPVPFDCANCGKRHLSLFKDLTSEEVDELNNVKACTSFKKGQIMMSEGSRPNGVFCIHSGKAKLHRLGQNGKDQIIRFAVNGDLIGYRSLLSEEPLSATVEALEDVHACYIPKQVLFSFLEKNPKFSLNILRMACHELGEAGKLITDIAQKSVRERLAEVLLMLKAQFGLNEETGAIDITLTREEIANMVGTATESVIRLISEFKGDGLIEVKGRNITILDEAQLVRVGKVFD
ncbi:Crp/Fnr family transcriptional regulator [Phaeocystidibacter luteus]|uniref:Crp/Fnr family transcriptional regulator n=1 Tax=Phaeocystidibacter luteus TaxID=911197 RepID=A0A6N6RJ81_9FLAO|nr:Crp/Fnr family transcriptional regulator [Phaeocystidibacter luteus]KAB2814046.1 Crp/Fnr family transcriptional regulator [Phaeocystidibacter luteus]